MRTLHEVCCFAFYFTSPLSVYRTTGVNVCRSSHHQESQSNRFTLPNNGIAHRECSGFHLLCELIWGNCNMQRIRVFVYDKLQTSSNLYAVFQKHVNFSAFNTNEEAHRRAAFREFSHQRRFMEFPPRQVLNCAACLLLRWVHHKRRSCTIRSTFGTTQIQPKDGSRISKNSWSIQAKNNEKKKQDHLYISTSSGAWVQKRTRGSISRKITREALL